MLHRLTSRSARRASLFNAGNERDLAVNVLVKDIRELAELVERQLLEHLSVLDTVGDQLTRQLVRASEGQALLGQIVGKVGGVDIPNTYTSSPKAYT